MKKSSLLILLITALLVFSQFNCNSPTAPNTGLSLTTADLVCTEVWLKLDFADSPNGGQYEIKRDGNIVLSGILSKSDTVLVDTTVLPSKSYTYIAYQMQNGKTLEQSSPLHITTLDSTSSNFNWQLYKFGNFNATGMPSMLYGVAAVNDTDIWAVGEIYTSDSVGKYNALHWDGTKWNLINIYYNYQGQNTWSTLRSIFAINRDDIWFGSNVRWNGKSFDNFPIDPVLLGNGINSIWGNQGGIYVIGNNGFIAFRNSSGNWNKIESGTSLFLYDIYSTNGKDVYVVGGDLNNNGILLKGNANSFKTLAQGNSDQMSVPHFDGVGRTVWVSNTGIVFFGGNLLYRLTDGQLNFVRSLGGNYLYGNSNGQYFGFLSQLRGLAENQMILVGQRNTVKYFNGMRWTQLGMPYDPNSGYTWVSVGMTNDLIIAVGYGSRNGLVNGGIIMMLKRQ